MHFNNIQINPIIIQINSAERRTISCNLNPTKNSGRGLIPNFPSLLILTIFCSHEHVLIGRKNSESIHALTTTVAQIPMKERSRQ